MENDLNKKLICIRCPRGCEIQTSLDGYGIITSISGNFCKLGDDYAKTEQRDPRRTVTTTIRVKNGNYPLLPVWTTKPIPKEKIFELIDMLRNMELDAPVAIGQVVLENIFNLGIDVTASKSIAKA